MCIIYVITGTYGTLIVARLQVPGNCLISVRNIFDQRFVFSAFNQFDAYDYRNYPVAASGPIFSRGDRSLQRPYNKRKSSHRTQLVPQA